MLAPQRKRLGEPFGPLDRMLAPSSVNVHGVLTEGTTRPSRDADEAGEALAQLPGVLVTQVDLVRRAVEGELQRLGGRCLVAVQIAHQHYLHPLGHFDFPSVDCDVYGLSASA